MASNPNPFNSSSIEGGMETHECSIPLAYQQVDPTWRARGALVNRFIMGRTRVTTLFNGVFDLLLSPPDVSSQ